MSKLARISGAEIDSKIITAKKSALVFVSAVWNSACQVARPIVEQLADEQHGRLAFFELDADAETLTATRLGIRSVPAYLVFSNGNLGATASGIIQKHALASLIAKV